jgi:hypothetical protein
MKYNLRFRAIFCIACAIALSSVFVQGQDEKSFQELLGRAKHGEAVAQWQLADRYLNGVDGKPDYGEAMKWYKQAVSQGDGVAMTRIGDLYANGQGVEKNPATAAEWYRKAMASGQQTFAEGRLLALSRAGLIKEKLAGLPVEGGLVLTDIDDTTPTAELVNSLSKHTELVETGKGYWIGYNDVMMSIAARGDAALPFLEDFVKKAPNEKESEAGILAIHLIGIGGEVTGRFEEEFKNRKARETLWALMKVDGLTDKVANLLKRDPWPADLPSYMEALAEVKGGCPGTLNALRRYHIDKLPIDPTAGNYFAGTGVRFTVPKTWDDRDYVHIALNGIKEAIKDKLVVENGLLDQIPVTGVTYENPSPTEWKGTIGKALDQITGYNPPFNYIEEGRAVFYYTDGESYENVTLHVCTAETAKKRLLDWWEKTGKAWYCH